MKFLYAKGNVVAIARFCEEEAFVFVLSVGQEAETVRLPLGGIGAKCPASTEDVFGRRLNWETRDKYSIELVAEAHQAYFWECKML